MAFKDDTEIMAIKDKLKEKFLDLKQKISLKYREIGYMKDELFRIKKAYASLSDRELKLAISEEVKKKKQGEEK